MKLKMVLLLLLVSISHSLLANDNSAKIVAQNSPKVSGINISNCSDFNNLVSGNIPSNTIVNLLVSCPSNSIKIHDSRNITIHGVGNSKPTISFINPFKVAVDISNSQFISFDNLSIDYLEPLYAKGIVSDIKGSKYKITVQPDSKKLGTVAKQWLVENGCALANNSYNDVLSCAYNSAKKLIYIDIFNKDGSYKTGSSEIYRILGRSVYGDSVHFIGASTIELDNPRVKSLNLNIGDVVAIQPGRFGNTFNIRNNSGAISLSHVDIFESPNSAVHDYNSLALPSNSPAAFTVKLDHVNVAPKGCLINKGDNSIAETHGNCSKLGLFSANKAGIHSQGGEKGPIVNFSTFVRTGDDPINVHGWFYGLQALNKGSCTSNYCSMNFKLVIKSQEKQIDDELFKVNEKVAIFNNATKQSERDELLSAVVQRYADNQLTLSMDINTYKAIANGGDFYLTVDGHSGRNAVVTNNLFAYDKRGVLIRSSYAKILNNQFTNIAVFGLWVGTEIGGEFYEGGFPEMPEIKGNYFNNVAFNTNACFIQGGVKKNCDWGGITIKVRKSFETPKNNNLLRVDKSMINGNRKDNRDYGLSQMCVKNTVDSKGNSIVGSGCVD